MKARIKESGRIIEVSECDGHYYEIGENGRCQSDYSADELELILTGTHNSMTYLPPKCWWMRLINVFAKCQRKTIWEQIRSDVKCVDLRVYKDGRTWKFAHGLVKYKKAELSTILSCLNYCAEGTIVRIILERAKNQDELQKFRDLCYDIQHEYSNLKFIGGNYKKTWEQLYNFPYEGRFWVHQHVSSMADDARWYERFIPILYAKRVKNHEMKPGINLIDFI